MRKISFQVEHDARVSGYWARKSLGRALMRALALEVEGDLVRAGYRVGQLNPDVVVRFSAELAGSTNHLLSATAMELVHDGHVIDRVEVRSPEDVSQLPAESYPEWVAATLVNAIARSAPVGSLALDPEIEAKASGKSLVLAAFDVFDSANNLDPLSRDQLSEYVAVRMTQSLGYRVVPRAEIKERLHDDKQSSYRPCVDQSCQIELGKALAAQKSLATTLIRVGGTCALTATLFDLKSETAEMAASVRTECSKDSLLQGVDALVTDLRKQSGRGQRSL
jgi:hypothetical protein